MKNLTEKEMQLIDGGMANAKRAPNSINSSSNPIYIIDGVLVEGQGS